MLFCSCACSLARLLVVRLLVYSVREVSSTALFLAGQKGLWPSPFPPVSLCLSLEAGSESNVENRIRKTQSGVLSDDRRPTVDVPARR